MKHSRLAEVRYVHDLEIHDTGADKGRNKDSHNLRPEILAWRDFDIVRQLQAIGKIKGMDCRDVSGVLIVSQIPYSLGAMSKFRTQTFEEIHSQWVSELPRSSDKFSKHTDLMISLDLFGNHDCR